MNKIIARMRGGLGNQLFILAFAYKIMSDMNFKDCELVLDTREYSHYKTRGFEVLQLINDNNIRVYDKTRDKNYYYDITRCCYHLIQKFLPNNLELSKKMTSLGLFYSKRSARGYFLPRKNKTIFLYGYFQDAEMAFSVRNIILSKIMDIPEKIRLASEKKYIAVSVRCGKDYIDYGWPICSEDYFKDSVREIVNEKYLDKPFEILIFSDDIDRAKKMNISTNCKYIEGASSIEQLYLMMQCCDFVLSNSSFSWWGAFLGLKNDSIIIAPDCWYDIHDKTQNGLLIYPSMRIRKI